MNIIGVDPSSSKCGVCFVKDGKVTDIGFFRSDTKDDLGKRIFDWYRYLRSFKAKRKVDCVAVEEDSVNRNLNTIRKISYFESGALLSAGEWGSKSLLIKPNTARKQALGNGALKKEEVYEIYRKEFKLRDEKDGGNDQSDAICIGLAANRMLRS